MKKATAFVLVLCLVLCLSACKHSGDEFEFSTSSAKTPEIEVSSGSKYTEDFFKNSSVPESAVTESQVTESVSSTQSTVNSGETKEKVNSDLTGWYFKHLSVTQKGIYKKIDTAVYNMKTGYINLGKVNYEDILLAFKSVLYDRPEYFWINNEYIIKYNKKTKEYNIGFSGIEGEKLDYLCNQSERIIMETEMETSFVEIKKLCSSATDDYSKELTVHNWLTEKITYDTEIIESHNIKLNPLSFTAYGGMVSRTESKKASAVCEGYSKAFKYILKRLGINSVLVSGKYDGVGHMWNAVELNGKWYNVDVTANDTNDRVIHTYFNVTDKAMAKTHKKDKDFYKSKIESIEKGEYNLFAPVCNSVEYSYFTKNGCVIKSLKTAPEQIAEYIIKNETVKTAEFAFANTISEYYNSENILEKINAEEIKSLVNQKTEKEFEFTVFGIENSKAFSIEW